MIYHQTSPSVMFVCVSVFILLLFGEWSGGRRVGSGQQTPNEKNINAPTYFI